MTKEELIILLDVIKNTTSPPVVLEDKVVFSPEYDFSNRNISKKALKEAISLYKKSGIPTLFLDEDEPIIASNIPLQLDIKMNAQYEDYKKHFNKYMLNLLLSVVSTLEGMEDIDFNNYSKHFCETNKESALKTLEEIIDYLGIKPDNVNRKSS